MLIQKLLCTPVQFGNAITGLATLDRLKRQEKEIESGFPGVRKWTIWTDWRIWTFGKRHGVAAGRLDYSWYKKCFSLTESEAREFFSRSILHLTLSVVPTIEPEKPEDKIFPWIHEPHGSFIRGEPSVSLLFESTGKWILRIYKKKSALGIPVTFEIGFRQRYAETIEQAITLANTILGVELSE